MQGSLFPNSNFDKKQPLKIINCNLINTNIIAISHHENKSHEKKSKASINKWIQKNVPYSFFFIL